MNIEISYNDNVFFTVTDEDQTDLGHKLISSDIENWIKHVINRVPTRLVKRINKRLVEIQALDEKELLDREIKVRPLPEEDDSPAGIELKFNNEIIYSATRTDKNILNEDYTGEEIESKFVSEITNKIISKIKNCRKAVEMLAFEEDPSTGKRRIPNPPIDKKERRDLIRGKGWYKNRDKIEEESKRQ